MQLAHNALSGREVAVKVFATRAAFKTEAALLANTTSPLRVFMPAMLALHHNANGALQGAAGAPLPPCIVMDRGEPLDVFCHLRNPSRSMTFVVRTASHCRASVFLLFTTFLCCLVRAHQS